MQKCLASLLACSLLPVVAAAQNGGRGRDVTPEVVRQGFPAAEADARDPAKSDTAWEIQWDFAPVQGKKLKLFRIRSATFIWKDANGQPRSLVVAKNLQLAEAFTQYDDGQTCFLDVASVPATQALPADARFLGPACVLPGTVLAAANSSMHNKVYREVHYDGLRWMNAYGGIRGRKGEKLILWSAIQAVNYIYIIEYDFTDDGRIVCRLGFTAHNYFNRGNVAGRPPHFRLNNEDVHLHIGCWRLDPELSERGNAQSGPGFNDLKLVRRVFQEGKFRLQAMPFPGDLQANVAGAREGSARWIAKEFTTLRAESTAVRNTRGQPIAYDLVSTRTGTTEGLLPIGHAKGADIAFINDDYWVTLRPDVYKHYHEVPRIAQGRPLAKQATTVWHSVPAIHVPRDEDFGAGGIDAARGVALTAWVEFTLRPRNLFDSTPLYRASIRGPQ